MKHPIGRKLARSLLLAVVASGTGVCLAQVIEEVWVNRPQVQIRSGKGAAFPVVATAAKGSKLQVVAKEDRWLKVQFNGAEGYVLADAISSREVKGGGGLGALASGPDSSGATAGAAGKGLQPEAEAYASSKGMDPKIVDLMIERRRAISGEEWAAFTKAGQVGPDKPAK